MFQFSRIYTKFIMMKCSAEFENMRLPWNMCNLGYLWAQFKYLTLFKHCHTSQFSSFIKVFFSLSLSRFHRFLRLKYSFCSVLNILPQFCVLKLSSSTLSFCWNRLLSFLNKETCEFFQFIDSQKDVFRFKDIFLDTNFILSCHTRHSNKAIK